MSMTVGIAIICEDGRSVVVAADRMVGISAGVPQIQLQVDTDCAKLRLLNAHVVSVFTGGTTDRDLIFRKAGDISKASVEEVANTLRTAFLELHQESLDEMLRKNGSSLQALKEPILNETFNKELLKLVGQHCITGSFLLAGAGDDESHIYTVDTSFVINYDAIGFYVVGSGSIYGLPVLSARAVNRRLSLEQAIFAAYEAKRIAEEAYGVGEKTDIAILSVASETRFLLEDSIDELKRLYLGRIRLSDSDMATIARVIQTSAQASFSSSSVDGVASKAVDIPSSRPQNAGVIPNS